MEPLNAQLSPDEEVFKEIKELIDIDTESDQSKKWAGSLVFLKKYVGAAISRINAGPRTPPLDPE